MIKKFINVVMFFNNRHSLLEIFINSIRFNNFFIVYYFLKLSYTISNFFLDDFHFFLQQFCMEHNLILIIIFNAFNMVEVLRYAASTEEFFFFFTIKSDFFIYMLATDSVNIFSLWNHRLIHIFILFFSKISYWLCKSF